MKCNECQEALSAYYDKILDKEQTAAVAAHLAECQTCKKEYEQLTMILGCLKEQQEETKVSSSLHEQMLDKVARAAQKDKVRPLFVPRIGGMVAALLVGAILIKMNPMEIGEISTSDEHYALSAVQAPETASEQEEKTRVMLDDQHTEAAVATGDTASGARISESRESVPDMAASNDAGNGSEEAQRAAIEEKAASRTISDNQLWEIETDNINDLTKYLEDYAKDVDAQMEISYEEKESFILYGITDTHALFEALQAQSFTKSIIIVDENGENIKIIIKA